MPLPCLSPRGLDICTRAPFRARMFLMVDSVALSEYVVSPYFLFTATDAVVSTPSGPSLPTFLSSTLPVVFTRSAILLAAVPTL